MIPDISNQKLFLKISFAFLLAYVIADIFFNTAANEANRNLVLHVQSPKNTHLLNFLSILSTMGETPFYIVCLFLLLFFSTNKLKTMIFICFHLSNDYLDSILKVIYAGGRPFLEYDDVLALSCECSNGRPSGHAQSSLLFYLYIADLFCNMVSVRNQKKTGVLLKITIKILAIAIILLIGCSRIYKGVHSFNQILLGWNYSQFITVLYFMLREPLYDTIKIHIENGKIHNEHQKRKICIYFLIFSIFLFISMLIFTLRYELTSFPQFWTYEYIKKCGNSFDKCMLLTSFLTSASGLTVFGICLGLLITNGSFKNESYWNSVCNLAWWKWVIRFIILAMTILIIIGIPFIISSVHGTSVYIIILLKNYLPYYVLGVALIYLIPLLYKLCKVDVDGDLMKCETDRTGNEIRDSNKLELS